MCSATGTYLKTFTKSIARLKYLPQEECPQLTWSDIWKGMAVCYYPDGIANILLLTKVKKNFRVVYNNVTDNEVHVYLPLNRVRSFKESGKGLHYSNMSNFVWKNWKTYLSSVLSYLNFETTQDTARHYSLKKILYIFGI